MARVPVEFEYPLYVPDYILRMKAKERVQYLMEKQQPHRPENVTTEQLQDMQPNQKVQGVVVVDKAGPEPVKLIIPAVGGVTAAELRYMVGMYTEGGYGVGPKMKAKQITREAWKRLVTNTVDYLVETRRNQNKFKIAT